MSALPEPADVLAYWIGDAATSPEAAGALNKLWFGKSRTMINRVQSRPVLNWGLRCVLCGCIWSR